jgi:heptosyltransferase-2
MPELKLENIKRIVVRGTNWIGDAMMTLPALRELRRLFPAAHITLATRSLASGLFEDSDFLDEQLIYDRRGLGSVVKQIREWRRRRFDLAVLFQNSFEAALLASAARVPIRIGYATEGRGVLLSNPVHLPAWRNSTHEVFYYLNIVAEIERCFGGKTTILQRDPDCTLSVSDNRKAEAREILRANRVSDGYPIIALCPGSTNSRAKRWPAERYALLADRLIAECGAEVLLIGSAAEADVSLAVGGLMRQKPIMLTGKTDLPQAVAVLSLVDLIVTNDTGPAHIASALGCPTLVIFGPTNPLTTRPFSPVAEIVRHPPYCAPCMLRDCPIDHRCMTAISPDEVFTRAQLLLEKKNIVRATQTYRESAEIRKELIEANS